MAIGKIGATFSALNNQSNDIKNPNKNNNSVMLFNSNKSNKLQQDVFQKQVSDRYDEIYAHELAHKNAAGSLGGSIVIEKDGNGIPTGGHVDIKMPGLDKENPDKTIEQADIVINSAMAPSDPSSQDYKVAAEARQIKSEAQNYKSSNDEEGSSKTGSKLNITA